MDHFTHHPVVNHILSGILLFMALAGVVNFFAAPDLKDVNDLRDSLKACNQELDSLHSYSTTLQVMEKTLILSYPQISKYEAKYFSHIFYDFAYAYKTDWTWYPAVAKVETNWNPTLVSKKRARGLFQLISSCAKRQAKKLGISYIRGYTEWTEINNIVMGIDYFSEGLDIGTDFAVKRYIGGDAYMRACDSNTVTIEKYSKDVAAERAKVFNIFQEHGKLFYIYKGIAVEGVR